MTLISFYCGKRSAAPWCLESRKAQFPNVACAWRVFPNAILLLGIGYKTFKTLFPDIGRSWTICKVGRLLCRRTPHSAMVLLFICQDPNCLFYPQMPRWYKWSLFLLKFSVDYILLHISFLDYSFWNSTSSFHFASKFCHTFLSFKDGNMLFWLSFWDFSQIYLPKFLSSFCSLLTDSSPVFFPVLHNLDTNQIWVQPLTMLWRMPMINTWLKSQLKSHLIPETCYGEFLSALAFCYFEFPVDLQQYYIFHLSSFK